MTVGIAGLGLIGGSLAKAYKAAKEPATVLGFDRDVSITKIAQIDGALDGELTTDRISECDLILIALYTGAAAEYLEKIAPYVRPDAVVVDCCGTKRTICKAGFAIAEKYGFIYAGGHPMAGSQYSGFKYSRANLFWGSSMIIVPSRFDDIHLTSHIKSLLEPVGFGRITVTTAEQHDQMIAFTSQMPHVVSNAFIKSPTAKAHKGFSAGSYKDLTRVAWLNEVMWTELFFENQDFLLREMDYLIDALKEYRTALAEGDKEAMTALLAQGRKCKEEIDG